MLSDLYYYARVTSTKFVVKNIAKRNKTVKIFSYPVYSGLTRDLLMIPGVSEADIRYSLLKGDLYIKLQYKELVVVESSIDLLQFNDEQRIFLETNGVNNGLQVTVDQLSVIQKQAVPLIGAVDSSNLVFFIPSGSFIQDSTYQIQVYRNGVRQNFLDDYFIAESGGPGSGFDTVIFTAPPLDIPLPVDVITADYYVNNN